jgi:NitT/TauT family transport system permease protein
MSKKIYHIPQPVRPLKGGDILVLLGVVALLYLGVRLALRAPATVAGPGISLAPATLPYYVLHSVGRMVAAYALSLAFTLLCGDG